MDTIYTDFLERQIREATALAESSDLLNFIPAPIPPPESGCPPNHFIAEFRCQGLVKDGGGKVVEFDRWGIGVRFPEDYLRSRLHVAEILSYLGPALQPWHPNIRPPFICLHLQPGMPLVEILFSLFDLLTWNNYAAADALNPEASQWARNQGHGRFPIDRRPLKRRRLRLEVVEVSEQSPKR
jgi:hypothetical protein